MAKRVYVRLNNREYVVEFDKAAVQVNGQNVELDEVVTDGRGRLTLRSGPKTVRAIVQAGEEGGLVTVHGRELDLICETERHRLIKKFASASVSMRGHTEVRASMPGMVVRVGVRPGAQVKRGEAVLILEAMKMENEIRAPMDGSICEIKVAQGQAVEKGDLLLVLES